MASPSDPSVQKGDVVSLRSTSDPYTDLQPGDEGVVQHVDELGLIHVRWDRGEELALIPGRDEYDVVG